MNLEKKKLSELKSPDYNPRVSVTDNKYFHDTLKQSIERFGYIDPIIWNKRSGNVVGGNQRLEILRERGDKEVEVVVVDFDEMEEKAANLALNKISGDWMEDKLRALIKDLTEQAPALLSYTGFNSEEIDKLKFDDQMPEEMMFKNLFQVVVECENEREQEKVFAELNREGYRCKILTL